jgi:hypothetical protein
VAAAAAVQCNDVKERSYPLHAFEITGDAAYGDFIAS